MPTSSIPAVIDWLVAGVTALGLPGFAISDGVPMYGSACGVTVGVTPGDWEIPGTVDMQYAGGVTDHESYSIPTIIWASNGGSIQKTARDAAFVPFNAILGMIRADRSAGGVLNGAYLQVITARLVQTSTDESGKGRIAMIHFDVHVEKNRVV
jgi:hypothetical protein